MKVKIFLIVFVFFNCFYGQQHTILTVGNIKDVLEQKSFNEIFFKELERLDNLINKHLQPEKEKEKEFVIVNGPGIKINSGININDNEPPIKITDELAKLKKEMQDMKEHFTHRINHELVGPVGPRGLPGIPGQPGKCSLEDIRVWLEENTGELRTFFKNLSYLEFFKLQQAQMMTFLYNKF